MVSIISNVRLLDSLAVKCEHLTIISRMPCNNWAGYLIFDLVHNGLFDLFKLL